MTDGGRPVEWTVESFSRERASGRLVRPDGERVAFGIEAWNLGDADERSSNPDDTSVFPSAGEPVRVTWKMSLFRKVPVPAMVVPTGRVIAVVKTHTLAAWLKAVGKKLAPLAGMTPKKVIAMLHEIDDELADEWSDGEPRTGDDFAMLLAALGSEMQGDDGWIYGDDHRWDRAKARDAIVAPFEELLPEDADIEPRDGGDESLGDYVARINRIARAHRAPAAWQGLSFDDELTFLLLADDAHAELVEGGYLPPLV